MKKLTTALIVVVLAAVSAIAVASNAMQTSSFSDTRRFFIPCLGEYASGTIEVSVKGHFFETPSGNAHSIDNWDIVLELTGESTGRAWIGTGVSPGVYNVVKTGEIFFFTDRITLKPLGEGPRVRFNMNYHVKFDEDGNLVSEMVNFATGEVWRCLGKT